jgi:hypothetical protein
MDTLFKPSYLDKFAAGIAGAILIYSRNAATSILLIGVNGGVNGVSAAGIAGVNVNV